MEEKTIELIDIFRLVKRRYKVIVITVAFFVLAASAVNFISQPVYEASFTLWLGKSKNLTTYMEIIKSRHVIDEAEKKSKNSGIDIGSPKVLVQNVKNSDIILVKVEASTAQKAKNAATSILNSFLDTIQDMQSPGAVSTLKLIDQQIEKAKNDLSNQELKLTNYKQKHDNEVSNTIIDKLKALDKLSGQNEARFAVANARLQVSQPFVFTNKVILDDYKTKISIQETQLAFLIAQMGEDHSEVISYRTEIERTKQDLAEDLDRMLSIDAAGLDKQQRDEIESVLLAEVERTVALNLREVLGKVVKQLDGEVAKLSSSEQELINIERGISVAEDKYSTLTRKREELRGQLTGIRMVDPVSVSNQPVQPKKTLNIIVASISGVVFGILAAFAYDYKRGNRARTNEPKA